MQGGRVLAAARRHRQARRATRHPRHAEGHARHVDRRSRAEGSRSRLRRASSTTAARRSARFATSRPRRRDAQRPQLTAQSPDSDRTVLLYWDKSGHEQGVRARFLDADGRIDHTNGQSRFIGAARPGDFWPAIDKGPKGFFVVWQDDRDKDKEYDLFVRALSNDLDTIGPETRLTDYYAPAKSKFPPPRVRYPSVAVAANTLLVAYRLEKDNAREHERLIMRLRVPLADLEKNGLEESKDPNRDSREFGDAKPVNEDKAPADAPSIGCGTEGCFVVWHGEAGGAYAAAIDPNVGRVQWRKKFSDKGGRPSIAVKDGQVAISFYEGGRLKMAFLSRDGVIAPSTLLHTNDSTSSTLPRPYLAAGANKNEWTRRMAGLGPPEGKPRDLRGAHPLPVTLLVILAVIA